MLAQHPWLTTQDPTWVGKVWNKVYHRVDTLRRKKRGEPMQTGMQVDWLVSVGLALCLT